jgi:hypothetical protein
MRAGADGVLHQQHLSCKLQARQLQQVSTWKLQLVTSTEANADQLPCMLLDPCLQDWQLAVWEVIPLPA